jgi:hypothetical protein
MKQNDDSDDDVFNSYLLSAKTICQKRINEDENKETSEKRTLQRRSSRRDIQNCVSQRTKDINLLPDSVTNRGLTRAMSFSDQHDHKSLRRGRRASSTDLVRQLVVKENMKQNVTEKCDLKNVSWCTSTNRGLIRSKSSVDVYEAGRFRRGGRRASTTGLTNHLVLETMRPNVQKKATVQDNLWSTSTISDDDNTNSSDEEDALKIWTGAMKTKQAKLDGIIPSEPNSSGLIHYEYSDDESLMQRQSKPPRALEILSNCSRLRDEDSDNSENSGDSDIDGMFHVFVNASSNNQTLNSRSNNESREGRR